MYKSIIKWILAITIQPSKAWKILVRKKNSSYDILGSFVYPLIGILTLVAFVSILLNRQEYDVQMALKSAITVLATTFTGYYLAVYAMNEIGARYFNQPKNINLWQQFIGFSSSLMFAMNVILMLIPDFFFLRIFVLYTFYIIWEGATVYMDVKEEIRLKFTGVVTFVLLFSPSIVEGILYWLMPGLRI